MSKTPEQRAARLCHTEGVSEAAIARAIRAAENAAYEEAARTAAFSSYGDPRNHLPSLIRALKTKAPRRRKATQ